MCRALAARRGLRASQRVSWGTGDGLRTLRSGADILASSRPGQEAPTGPREAQPDAIADLKSMTWRRLRPQACHRLGAERQLPSVPPPAAVPSATEQQDDEDNNEKRGGIHVRLLRRCARISALRVMHSSCNRMLGSAVPFRMRHRGITAIGAGAKDEYPASRRGSQVGSRLDLACA